MYNRHKILLNLIAAFGNPGVEKIILQKLLFLFCQTQKQRKKKPTFNFVPYKYGCVSFQATKDLHVLAKHYHVLEESNHEWGISKKSDYLLHPDENLVLNGLVDDFKEHDNTHIINHVYDNYPYYTIRSVRKKTARQKKACKKEKRLIQAQMQKCLFTIGYEGSCIDAYLNLLVKNNISLLCDVRKNPVSRKYGFSKNRLKEYCAKLDIGYEHIPELGIESQKRKSLNSRQDYQNLFTDYVHL